MYCWNAIFGKKEWDGLNNNQRSNQIAIKQFRKELQGMFDDITDIDIKVLNRAVNEGVSHAKRNTPTVTSFMKKSWKSAPAVKAKAGGASKNMVNTADYSEYVNYGHRRVNKAGETIGFVEGKFMLEKAMSHTEKAMEREFEKEVKKVNKEHDK